PKICTAVGDNLRHSLGIPGRIVPEIRHNQEAVIFHFSFKEGLAMTKHGFRFGSWFRPALVALAVAVLALVSGDVLSAQQTGAASGVVHGTVKDQSGGALPGVTVTLSSPALQVRQMTTVTDAEGAYRFSELPLGTYKITYELSGFSTFVRDEVRLPVGFTALIDAEM